jgi:N-acetylneuraminic acid mutarotase
VATARPPPTLANDASAKVNDSFCLLFLAAIGALACGAEGPAHPTDGPQPAHLELTLTWDPAGPDSATPRYEAQGDVVGRKLYVFGGFVQGDGWPVTTDGEAFDLDTRAWTTLAPAPEKLTHAGRATDGQFLYFAGGFLGDGPGGSTDHTWRYEPASDTWQAMAPLPASRGAGALVLLGAKLHYFGGAVRPPDQDIIASDHGEHWALDWKNASAQWTQLAPLPTPRNHLGGCAVAGKVYAIGGQSLLDEHSGNYATVDAYDPQRDEWTRVASLPLPIGHLTSNTLEYKGRLLVVSGVTQGSTKLATVFAFDPSLGTWSELSALPEPRHSPVSSVIGDTLIVAAGSLSTSREIRAQTWLGTLRLE